MTDGILHDRGLEGKAAIVTGSNQNIGAAIAGALAALGCDELQGYGFGRPMAQDDFLRWVQGWSAGHERRRHRPEASEAA